MSLSLLSFLLILLGAMIDLWSLLFSSKSKKLKIAAGIIVIGIGVLLGGIKYCQDYRIEKEMAISGYLDANNPEYINYVTVYYGNNTFQFPRQAFLNGKEFTIPIAIGDFENNLQFKYTSKFFVVSTTIRDISSKIIAKINDNEWDINPNNYYKRNYDRTALEVIDQYGIPVLQVENFNNEKIRINGIYISHNAIRALTSKGLIQENFSKKLDESTYLKFVKNLDIKPWFEYSKDSQGKRSKYGELLKKRYQEDLELRRISFTWYSLLPFENLLEKAVNSAQILRRMENNCRHPINCENADQSVVDDSLDKERRLNLKIYHEKLKVLICMLRNEAIRRFYPKFSLKNHLLIYEDPTNISGLVDIADDIETLYRSSDYAKLSKVQLINETKLLLNQINKLLESWEFEKKEVSERDLNNSYLGKEKLDEIFGKSLIRLDSLNSYYEFTFRNDYSIKAFTIKTELSHRIPKSSIKKGRYSLKKYAYTGYVDEYMIKQIINELKYLLNAYKE